MVVALAGMVLLWVELFTARRRAHALQRDLVRAEADLVRFRAESQDHLRGLAVAIDRQPARWALSAAERDVVLLLLLPRGPAAPAHTGRPVQGPGGSVGGRLDGVAPQGHGG